MAIIYKGEIQVDVSVDEFWEWCNEMERKELKDLVIEHFELPHLGLELPLDESIIEYMIETYGDGVMTAQAREFVKEQIKELVWKLEHRKFS